MSKCLLHYHSLPKEVTKGNLLSQIPVTVLMNNANIGDLLVAASGFRLRHWASGSKGMKEGVLVCGCSVMNLTITDTNNLQVAGLGLARNQGDGPIPVSGESRYIICDRAKLTHKIFTVNSCHSLQ